MNVSPSNQIWPKIGRLCTDGFRNRRARFSAIFFPKRRGTRCESLVRSVPDRGGQKFLAEKTDYISTHYRTKVGPVSAPSTPEIDDLRRIAYSGDRHCEVNRGHRNQALPSGADGLPLAPLSRCHQGGDCDLVVITQGIESYHH
jgi:hypothetical protein